MSLMFGLVGLMGLAQRSGAAAPAAPAPAPAPAQVVVVIHRSGEANSATPPGAVAATAAPIALTATPAVRQAPANQSPVAQTNGSR